MLPFFWYLLKVTSCSAILSLYYLLVLRNKKFHHYNRFYLLSALAVSWLIPLIKIDFWTKSVDEIPVVNLLTVVASSEAYIMQSPPSISNSWNWNALGLIAFTLVSAIFLALVLGALVKIFRLIKTSAKEKWHGVYFIFTQAKGAPFSFFKYIFWNETIDITTKEGTHMLQHELAHVHEKHSLDKLFMNMVLVVGWFNPFFWLIKKELNMLHEFIADEKAITDGDISTFASTLLQVSFPRHSNSLANSFFHSPIKRRLLMLTTSKHPRYSYLRRLMILPLLSVLCVLFAFKIKQDGNKAKETVPSLRSQTEEKQMQELDFKEQKHATTNMEVNMQQKDQKLVDNGEQEDVDKSFLEREQDTTRKSKHQQDSASSNRYKPAIVILDGEKMTHEEYEARKIDRSELYSILYTKYDKLGEEGKNGVLIAITKQKGVAADKLPSGEEWKKPLYYGADTKPFYPGGREALTKYIKSNLNYPEAAKKKKIEVRVTVAFVVETDGSINYFAPWTKWGYGFEEEAIRLIKNSGKWMPGTYKGKAVDCKVNMTIDFALDGPSVSAGF